jgi:hypothetical protein
MAGWNDWDKAAEIDKLSKDLQRLHRFMCAVLLDRPMILPICLGVGIAFCGAYSQGTLSKRVN